MSRRHVGIACIFGLFLGCGPAPDRSSDTPFVGAGTRVEEDAPALAATADVDGPVEVEDVAPARPRTLTVVTQAPIDADVVASTEPSYVVITRAGSEGRIARIASASISDLHVDDDETTVTWFEPSPSGVAHLHTFDVATGVHLRFATDNPGWTTTR